MEANVVFFVAKEKINIFGKTAFDISSLVNVQRTLICSSRVRKAGRDQSSKEIQSDFLGDVTLRFNTVKRFQQHTGCENRSQFRLLTKWNYKAMRSLQASFMRFLSQPDPFRSYKSFRNFGAWFCTTRAPKLLTWLKNVLIGHTFVLKFVQN